MIKIILHKFAWLFPNYAWKPSSARFLFLFSASYITRSNGSVDDDDEIKQQNWKEQHDDNEMTTFKQPSKSTIAFNIRTQIFISCCDKCWNQQLSPHLSTNLVLKYMLHLYIVYAPIGNNQSTSRVCKSHMQKHTFYEHAHVTHVNHNEEMKFRTNRIFDERGRTCVYKKFASWMRWQPNFTWCNKQTNEQTSIVNHHVWWVHWSSKKYCECKIRERKFNFLCI